MPKKIEDGTKQIEIRGVSLERDKARLFRENYHGVGWIEKLIEGFDFMLTESKEKKLSTKERHALYKWIYDEIR